jgi:hypothetical protein
MNDLTTYGFMKGEANVADFFITDQLARSIFHQAPASALYRQAA